MEECLRLNVKTHKNLTMGPCFLKPFFALAGTFFRGPFGEKSHPKKNAGASSRESELLAFFQKQKRTGDKCCCRLLQGHERTWRDPILSETWNELTNAWRVSCWSCKEPDNNQFHIFGFSRLFLNGKRPAILACWVFSRFTHKK
jgi:hypothetical protein